MAKIRSADLVGAWQLARWETVYADGSRSAPFGPRARGLLQYTADGWMSATIMAADRPRLSRGNPRAAPKAERAAAFDSYFSYAGRFRVKDEVVRHDVMIALNPALAGTPQLREARLVGRTLTLSASEDSPGGMRTHRLVWRRARRASGDAR